MLDLPIAIMACASCNITYRVCHNRVLESITPLPNTGASASCDSMLGFCTPERQGSSSDSQAHSANTPAVHQSVSPTRSGLRLVTFLLRPLPALHGAGQMVSQYHTDTKIRSTNSPVWQLGSFRPTTEEYLPQSSLYHHNFIDCFLARDESPFRKGSIKHSLYRSGDSYLQ